MNVNEKRGNEKRRHKRYPTDGMDIKCQMLYSAEAKLLDMSLSGASIIVGRRFNKGDRHTLRVPIDGREMTVTGEVVWVAIEGMQRTEPGESVVLYRVGFKFDDMLSNKGNEVMGFLAKSVERRKLSPRLGGVRIRFDSERSVVEVPHECPIKKVSQGGMLIETTRELAQDHRLPLEISLYDGIDEPLKCTGRVASCIKHPSRHPYLFDVGIEFFDLNGQDRVRLDNLIQGLELS